MKDIANTIGKYLGLIFAAAVILFTASLTLQLAQRLIPDNVFLQYMTLVLFDVAAFVWFVMFITQAKGTVQWALAGIGFLVGLAGAIIMAGGELILGQKLVVISDPSRIGWVLVATVIIAALTHVTLAYAFHFSDPAVKNRVENAQEVSKAISRAYEDARAQIARNADLLTAGLVESTLFEAGQQISAATVSHIRNANALEEKTAELLRGAPVISEKKDKPGVTWPWAWPWKKAEETVSYNAETAAPSQAVTPPFGKNGTGSEEEKT
jgi:hypothetical protein